MARVALLIGIRDYGNGIEPLPAAIADAEAFSDVLRQRSLGYFCEIKTLTDAAEAPAMPQSLSRTTLEETLESWCRERDAEDELLLYFSGHLIWDSDDDILLATSGTRYERGTLVRSSAIALRFIHQCLQRSPAQQQLVILDCSVLSSDGHPPIREDRALHLERHLGGDRRLILSASDDSRYSPEHKQGRMSLYTHYLLEGIRTGMAAHHNAGHDAGEMTAADAHSYVEGKMAIATPAVTPVLIASADLQPTSLLLAKAHLPPSHRAYCDEVQTMIQRHGLEEPDLSREILHLVQTRLGLSDECAEALRRTLRSPYELKHRSLTRYREVASDVIQTNSPATISGQYRLEEARHRLGLRQEDTAPINDEICYLNRLRHLNQYRTALRKSFQNGIAPTDATQQDLETLRQLLNISPEDAERAAREIESHSQVHHHKQEVYRIQFSEAIERGVAHNSLIREELDNFRQSLGLSNAEIERIEAEVKRTMTGSHFPPQPPDSGGDRPSPHSQGPSAQNGASQNGASHSPPSPSSNGFPEERSPQLTHERKLQEYRNAFTQMAQQHIPLTADAQTYLAGLREVLGLSEEEITPIEREAVQQIKEAAAQYQRNLATYEQEFSEAVDQSFPLTQDRLDHFAERQRQLNLDPRDVRIAEEQVEKQWRLKHQMETGSPTLPQTELETPASSPPHGASSAVSPNAGADAAVGTQTAPPATELEAPAAVPSPAESPVGSIRPPSDELDENDLPSERGIDYSFLVDSLAHQRWRDADEKTFEVMLELANQGLHKSDWLDPQAIANLPCTDLHTLNRLWTHYSQGRFGFSVQCNLYFGLAMGYSSNDGRCTTFGKQVGWMLWEKEFIGFKYYNQLTFHHLRAPEGHLPAKWFWQIPWLESLRCGGLGTGRGGCGEDGGMLFTFMSKLVNCDLKPR